MVFPIDHAFWDTHYPPNGWNCRCTVRARSKEDVDELGLNLQETAPKSKTLVVADGDSVIKDMVPAGIDPGWDHHVGKSWIAPEVALGQKLARLPVWLRGSMTEKSVSPEFLNAIEAGFSRFQKEVKGTSRLVLVTNQKTGAKEAGLRYRPQGRTQVLGYMDRAIIDSMAEKLPEIPLDNTLLAVEDSSLRHVEGAHKALSNPRQVWPDSFLEALPSHLRRYRAVFWDVDNQSLLYVPSTSFNNTVPVASFKQSKKGVWHLVGLGTKRQTNLETEKKYLPLAGKL